MIRVEEEKYFKSINSFFRNQKVLLLVYLCAESGKVEEKFFAIINCGSTASSSYKRYFECSCSRERNKLKVIEKWKRFFVILKLLLKAFKPLISQFITQRNRNLITLIGNLI